MKTPTYRTFCKLIRGDSIVVMYKFQKAVYIYHTVAPLLSPVQEVSCSPSEITIEMHMHDGTEVGHYMGDNMK